MLKPNDTYTLIGLFGDKINLTKNRIFFLNTMLKKLLKHKNAPMLPKIKVKGDEYPSNQWPAWTAPYACAMLVAIACEGMPMKIAGQMYVTNRCLNDKVGTVYKGDWIHHAEKEFGIPLQIDVINEPRPNQPAPQQQSLFTRIKKIIKGE